MNAVVDVDAGPRVDNWWGSGLGLAAVRGRLQRSSARGILVVDISLVLTLAGKGD